jgi:regulator of PEP synthase PpsR (kinase-PPPase family)
MLRKRILFPLVITFFISCGLITHLVSTHTKKPRLLSQTVNPAPSYEPSIIPDLSNPEVREEIQRKIMEEKAYTHDFIRLPLDYFEKEFEEEEKKAREKNGENNLRKLEQYNYFDDVSIVDPLITPIVSIFKWFSMKQFSSNIILYPYQFD